MMKRRIALSLPLGLGLTGAARAQASYPTRSIRLVVGFAAGGPTDVIARLIAQDMTATLGQPVVVENRTGANALIATQFVAREAPDGYTILLATLSHSVNAILLPNNSYRPIEDFTPVGLVAMLPLIAVTGANTPFRSLQQVVDAAREAPGTISYGSAGNGGSAHLAAALLASRSNTQMTHVPFRGNAPALTEVMAGRVSFMFYPMIGIGEYVAKGQLRPLAISTAERSGDYPEVPTMREIGYPGFEDYTQGLGVVAPAQTPPAVVARLNAAVRASLARPETAERLKGLGGIAAASSPEEYGSFLRGDLDRWRRVIEAANISL
ncbi:Bug family tripartite tricarboxylate transporter substrate binding protein [Roseococcus sp.]|uniref:Bug family tripartite tricarboxylate transporter substrate binding protein n=1 Tax=Roseococcus sp. TaxID=2109646 RepID=UPI003BA8CEFE